MSAALLLAGCGGTSDDAGTATSATPSRSPASGGASPQVCPITPASVPPPAGASTDLAVKPVIAPDAAPPPTVVTVADIVPGTGAEATTLAGVKAKYVGALYTTGAEFDASWGKSPDTIPFNVCATGTVPGFAIGPLGMKVGGRRQVTIPAEYGYGAEGQPPAIPGGAALVFVIDLVEVTPPSG